MDIKHNWSDFVVTVVTSTKRMNMADTILNNFLRQDYHPKELIILLNTNDLNTQFWKKKTVTVDEIRIYRLDESKTLGECLNFVGEHANFNVIAKFDDDDYYSPCYLTNMINQLEEKRVDVIGKSSIFVYFTDEKKLSLFRRRKSDVYLRKVSDLKRPLAGGTLVFKKDVLKKVSFAHLNLGEDLKFQIDCLHQGFSMLSSDPYDYVLLRHKPEQHQHTWAADYQIFQQNCQLIAVTAFFEDIVQRPDES